MPLNWDISRVADYKKLYGKKDANGNKYLKTMPERIIMLTMAVGIREISDKNWEKFYNRVHLLERIHGCSYYKTVRGKHVPMYITREDVQRMIGLHTNSSTMTRSEFLKRQTRGLDI